MNAFTRKTLDEISDRTRPFPIVDGPFGTQLHADEYTSDGIPLVRVTNLSFDGIFQSDNLVFISEEKALELQRSKVLKDDLIVAKTGATIGKCSLFPFEHGVIASSCIKLSADRTKADPRFLLHQIVSHDGQKAVLDGASGSTRTTINIGPFKQIAFPFPDIAEQSRIATVLNTINEAIAKTEAVIAKLKQVRAGLVHDLLTRGLDEDGQLRDPISRPEHFKDSPLGKFPWKLRPLSEVSEKIGDGVHASVEIVSDGHPFLYVSCIRDGVILWHNCAHITPESLEEMNRGKDLRRGTVLYTVVGSLGHASVIQDDVTFSFQRHIAYINPKSSVLNSEFLSLWLNSISARRYAESIALGNAQKTITLGLLADFWVPLPNIDEQANILFHLVPIEREIVTLLLERTKLTSLKSGLMADLLSGRIRVPEGTVKR